MDLGVQVGDLYFRIQIIKMVRVFEYSSIRVY